MEAYNRFYFKSTKSGRDVVGVAKETVQEPHLTFYLTQTLCTSPADSGAEH